MPHKGHSGGSMGGVEKSPARASAERAARRRQEAALAAKAGPVSTVYACICAKNPEACRAAEHPGRGS